MKSLRANLLVGVAVGSWLAQAYEVEYFYTETLDTCQISGVSMEADEQTEHGGICAFVPSTRRIYACPAPDPTCWTWNQNCQRGETTPGTNQILCSAAGTSWCCSGDETCTVTQNQINVCISNFTSPNSGIDIAKANATELQVLGVSNVTATSQTVDPTPFSTRVVSGTSTTDTTTSTSSSTSSNTSTTPTSTPSVSPIGSLTSSSKQSSGLSAGAIAGIVVGVVLGLGLVGVVAFIFGRRRQRTKAANCNQHASEAPTGISYYKPPFMNEKDRSDGATSELGDDGALRAEMPTTGTGRAPEIAANERPQVRHEMAG